ncbi:MAG: ribosome silencing factor [Gaiellales bacterium]|nr:ribosome silencing factor [Gaiellales bacterium]
MPEPPERVRQPADADQQEEIHRRALLAAAIAADLKAEDIRVLDMRSLVSYTDFLVVCTGRSTRQTRRISEEIGLRLKRELRLLPLGVQGDRASEWILMDYLDFIVHIFTPETRDFYRLDVMWKEAPAETVGAAGVVAVERTSSAAVEEESD